MMHSIEVHRESYAAKAHQSTIYKGLKAVGAGNYSFFLLAFNFIQTRTLDI